jgi:hypothetical protein
MFYPLQEEEEKDGIDEDEHDMEDFSCQVSELQGEDALDLKRKLTNKESKLQQDWLSPKMVPQGGEGPTLEKDEVCYNFRYVGSLS